MVSVLISMSGMSAGLLVARQDALDAALPGTEEVEAAEFLREFHRLVDHALLDVIPAQLDEAGQREVLAQRMALEAVVGEDAAKIGMIGEPHAIEIVGLALEPWRGTPDRRGRRYGRRFVGRNLDPHPLVLDEAQQIVDRKSTR